MADFPTFTLTDSHDDTLTISREVDGKTDAIVAEIHGDNVYVPKEQTPAVALAILEAAQAHNLDGTVAQAIVALRGYIAYSAAEKRREKAAQEAEKAREAKKLDAEALAMLNAYRRSIGVSPLASLGSVEHVAEPWRAAAKVARELHSA